MNELKETRPEPLWPSIIVLGGVCLVAALFLGFSYTLTKDKIDLQIKIDLNRKLTQVFAQATEFRPAEGYFIVYQGKDIVGYVAVAESPGYCSLIKVIVGMDLNNKIAGIRILEFAETAGLGTKVAEPDFYNQFVGLTSADMNLRKYGGKIDAITGATVSSKAVIEGVKNILVNKLEKLVENKQQEMAREKGGLK